MGEDRRSEDPRIGQILHFIEGQPERDRERDVRQAEMFDLKLQPINKMLGVHDRTLFGDGSEDNQGLRVKVHDLEQSEKRKSWVLAIMSAPVLGGIGLKIWELLRK